MVDLKAGLRARGQQLTELALNPWRLGGRTVRVTPQAGLGFGNHLYLWLNAYVEQRRGNDYRVLAPMGMNGWLDELPKVREHLTLTERQIRFVDRRKHWQFDLNARFGTDFTREELREFVCEFLIGSPLLSAAPTPVDVLTVNVRRGNYYSEPHFRGTYSFDIPEYLDVALAMEERKGGEVGKVLVVSDDVAWCRTKLSNLFSSRGANVEYVRLDATAKDHFRLVATSRRIIGTNSTFSYWASYVSNVIHGIDSRVVMPAFHARLGGDFRAYQLDPIWEIVEDIPGGWDG